MYVRGKEKRKAEERKEKRRCRGFGGSALAAERQRWNSRKWAARERWPANGYVKAGGGGTREKEREEKGQKGIIKAKERRVGGREGAWNRVA